MEKYICSIDPGKSGSIVQIIYRDNKVVKRNINNMPIKKIETKAKQMQLDLDFSTTKAGKKQFIKSGPNKGQVKMKLKTPAKYKTELDVKAIYKLFKHADIIVIEAQNPRPGNSAMSSASTMKNFGKLLALAELTEAKLELVTPMVWKKYFDLNMKPSEKKLFTNTQYKQLSIDKAQKVTGSEAKHDGQADALLIGYYYIDTKLKGEK